MIPALCTAADDARVAIEAVALSERLAALYFGEMPGLVEDGLLHHGVKAE